MYCAIFLYVASIANDDLAKISPQYSSGADIDVFTYDYIARYIGLWVYKCTWMYNGLETLKFINRHLHEIFGAMLEQF